MNHSRFRLAAWLAAASVLAVPGAARAQSGVTLAGLVDLSVGETRPIGGAAVKGVDSGKMTTSWLGVRGSEDLGSGLAAVFTLESFHRLDSGASGRSATDTFWARNAWVGLASPAWGRVTLGRHTTPLFVTTLAFNAFGDSFGYSPSIRHYFTSGTTTGDSGWSDALMYSSPSLGGAVLTLIGAAGEGSGGRNTGATLRYTAGAVDAALSVQDVKKDGSAPVADTRTWQANGAYDFGAAKLFLQFGKVDNRTTSTDHDIVGLGATVPVGAGKLLAQWGRISPQTGARRKTLSVGYDHFLSKRTDAYAVAMSDRLDGQSSGRGVSLGIRHRF